MDDLTADFYRRYAADSVAQVEAPESAMSRHFDAAFVPGARILDVGAGSGRDLAVLRSRGHDAYGIEPNDAMRAIALQLHPELADRLAPAALPDIGTPFGGRFDGVVCSAVLMHVADADLGASLQSLVAVLVPAGRLLLSIPAMEPQSITDGRDRDGRAFSNHAPATIAALMQALGFRRIEQWQATLPDVCWTTELFGRE
jgi:SAM-dependent methyltransferase